VANHRTAADREQARQACALFGLATSAAIDPAEALLGEVTRTHMAILYYEAEIALLPEDEQGRFRLYRQTRHASGEKTGEAKPHVLVVLWMAERKHLAEVTSKALSAGVAQRTLELQEGIARQVSSILARQARLLGHDPDSAAVRLASRQALELEAGDGRAAA
jgi:hypothetical protein